MNPVAIFVMLIYLHEVRVKSKNKLSIIAVLTMISTAVLIQNDHIQLIRSIDILQLIGCGMCIGVLLMMLFEKLH